MLDTVDDEDDDETSCWELDVVDNDGSDEEEYCGDTFC